MYQIKYSSGNEIQVMGDACRIIGPNFAHKFGGTYDQCVEWLEARGCKEVAGNTAHSVAVAQGRGPKKDECAYQYVV